MTRLPLFPIVETEKRDRRKIRRKREREIMNLGEIRP
jgi:hypothetical protein